LATKPASTGLKSCPTLSENDDLLALVAKMQRELKTLQAQTGAPTDLITEEDDLPSDDSAIDIRIRSDLP